MSPTSQNIIIAVIGILAIAFLIKKYVWTPKKKGPKSCENKGCGC